MSLFSNRPSSPELRRKKRDEWTAVLSQQLADKQRRASAELGESVGDSARSRQSARRESERHVRDTTRDSEAFLHSHEVTSRSTSLGRETEPDTGYETSQTSSRRASGPDTNSQRVNPGKVLLDQIEEARLRKKREKQRLADLELEEERRAQREMEEMRQKQSQHPKSPPIKKGGSEELTDTVASKKSPPKKIQSAADKESQHKRELKAQIEAKQAKRRAEREREAELDRIEEARARALVADASGNPPTSPPIPTLQSEHNSFNGMSTSRSQVPQVDQGTVRKRSEELRTEPVKHIPSAKFAPQIPLSTHTAAIPDMGPAQSARMDKVVLSLEKAVAKMESLLTSVQSVVTPTISVPVSTRQSQQHTPSTATEIQTRNKLPEVQQDTERTHDKTHNHQPSRPPFRGLFAVRETTALTSSSVWVTENVNVQTYLVNKRSTFPVTQKDAPQLIFQRGIPQPEASSQYS